MEAIREGSNLTGTIESRNGDLVVLLGRTTLAFKVEDPGNGDTYVGKRGVIGLVKDTLMFGSFSDFGMPDPTIARDAALSNMERLNRPNRKRSRGPRQFERDSIELG